MTPLRPSSTPAIDELDRLVVPLPNGTEVTTRVERRFEGILVPQGALARVVRTEGDRVEVRVVDGGRHVYLRSELLPRSAGQFRFAVRRQEAWSALRETVVLETVVGSRAWGLADEDSDVDRRGVFVLPFSWTIGLVDPPTELISVDGSETFWEVGKAIRQAIRADPNTLEMLFLDGAGVTDPMGEWLLEVREVFATREIYSSFGRYALSQLKRLEKSLRLAEHRAHLLEWLRREPELSLTELARRLQRACAIEAPTEQQGEQLARQYIKQLYRSMFDHGLLEKRTLASLTVFARENGGDFDLPRELGPKNAYNLLRLIDLAIGWLTTGSPSFRAASPLREELLAIKRGGVSLERVRMRAEEMAASLEDAKRVSRLPEKVDLARVDQVLKRIRREAAGRHFDGVPGVFGADAPDAPTAEWRSTS